MTAADMLEHFLSRATWVNRQATVDRILYGPPDRTVEAVAVAWIASWTNLRAAAENRCRLFISHEPLFYTHEDPPDDPLRREHPGAAKLAWLEQSGMTILRCHDAWDTWPEVGIRDSWAAWLGLGSLIARDATGYCGVHEIAPAPLRDFARHVSQRIGPLGQEGVWVTGQPGRIIRRVGAGTGCAVPAPELIRDAQADAVIATADGAWEWRHRQRLLDAGAAIVLVEHSTSEKPGMMNLAEYLRATFPALAVHYLPGDSSWLAGR